MQEGSPSLLISGSGSWPLHALAVSLAFAAENTKTLPLAKFELDL